ncbi:hypothetical protein RF11_15062 [Thelohanellus kitauei]|uniref:Uncharacterized protein n=1 Tax=Thelohanellus kitauei TaxID=669202 RepID=A0A0C2M9Y8_THEKT|nr:hypothetical protein RF11_15062 [Thelohanellus kitauei]
MRDVLNPFNNPSSRRIMRDCIFKRFGHAALSSLRPALVNALLQAKLSKMNKWPNKGQTMAHGPCPISSQSNKRDLGGQGRHVRPTTRQTNALVDPRHGEQQAERGIKHDHIRSTNDSKTTDHPRPALDLDIVWIHMPRFYLPTPRTPYKQSASGQPDHR